MPYRLLALLVVSCLSLRSQPVAEWSFEDKAPNTAVDAAKTHTLRLQGVQRVKGAIGQGLHFAGGASDVQGKLTDDLQSPEAVTIEAWVCPEGDFAKQEGPGIVYAGNYLMRITRGTPSFHVFTTGWKPVLAASPAQPGAWLFLAGTYDGSEMRIYVNGQLSGSLKRTGAIPHSKNSLVLGKQAGSFTGVIDEVRITRSCLSEEQIAAHFAADCKRLNPGVSAGKLRQPFEEFFGDSRKQNAPLPTTAHLPPADLTFAILTDTHIGTKGQEAQYCHNWRVEEAFRQINGLKPAFVVNCGDIITTFPNKEEFEAQCQYAVELQKQCQAPLRLVPGNHDIGNQASLRVWDENWAKRAKLPVDSMYFNAGYRETYRKYFGEDYYRFEADGCVFLVMDNAICNSGGELEKSQMAWLEQELAKAQDAKQRVVFLHNPLFWRRLDEPGPNNYESVMEPARTQLLDLFAKYRVDAVYSGHTHFGFANSYRGMWLRTINSTTFNRNYPTVAEHLPGTARIYDPYQLGFLVVRLRDGKLYESWVNTYWRMPEPPPALAKISGGRLVGRSASEVGASVLAVRATIPKTFALPNGGREGVNGQSWRVAEEIGATTLQIWPPPGPKEDWEDLDRALTLGRPHGVKVAVPVPGHPKAMEAAWARLKPHADAIDTLLVGNGLPMNPSAPLASWRYTSEPEEWISLCSQARKLAPKDTKIVLARLPLLGEGADKRLADTAKGLQGEADGICVWLATEDAPETVESTIHQAIATAKADGLTLWLDADCWREAPETLRNAYFLRLLALCQTLDVRLTWWPDLLDKNLDPTPLYYAAQAWQSIANPGSGTLETVGNARVLRWRDASGTPYTAWWRPDSQTAQIDTIDLPLPANATIIDPLHARLLKPNGGLPLCAWPLLVRRE
jgi:predicted MPP superfamily phosphohydrolase